MLRPPHLVARYSTIAPTIRDIFHKSAPINSDITCCGHIKSIRNFKKLTFLDVSDGSSAQSLNVIMENSGENKPENAHLVGQSVEVKGQWVESRGTQANEVRVVRGNPNHSVTVLGTVPENYPIQKKNLTLQFLRGLPTLRHRTSTLASIVRFRSGIELSLAKFFEENRCVKVSPPILTSSDCEGAGKVFIVESANKSNGKFFEKPAFLTVSAQLHLEVLALSLNRVWCLSPCFRAEDSHTNRHLCEFWMLEAELSYVTEIAQLTDFVENMIRSVIVEARGSLLNGGLLQDLLQSRYSEEDRQKVTSRWDSLASIEKWPSVTYNETIKIINEHKNKASEPLLWGDDILTEHEKWLAGTHFKSPVFVTDYPKAQKPFYMPNLNPAIFDSERPNVACFDLIIPEIGELVGGSLRECNLDNLVVEMKSRGMNPDTMEWYLSTRENGSTPHGGFGLGFERLIAYLSGIDNIKDVSAFPRAPGICPC
ncbi:asparaginyl-tRNA synthetase [Metschnikowia bicuspidata]|uniref:asparagine--tRNA ligase n=1 Tax=Metschnikowia bicuspidata TaxID=27322 RepID=A0A4V1J311_9ASCO|nr:asparaginyl-tRNA synthetase [Metschnikowia bicuspidata]